MPVGTIALYDTDELNRHVAIAVYFDQRGSYLRCLGVALDEVFRSLTLPAAPDGERDATGGSAS